MISDTFDSAFFLTLAGVVAGILGVLVNSCLKSRCKQVSCCCLSCLRDTDEEGLEAIAEMTRPQVPIACR